MEIKTPRHLAFLKSINGWNTAHTHNKVKNMKKNEKWNEKYLFLKIFHLSLMLE